MPAYAMATARSVPTDNPVGSFQTSAPVANPDTGAAVIMSPFSGPKGSPFDAKMYPAGTYQPTPAQRVADPNNVSTGALATGIGFGLTVGVADYGAISPANADPKFAGINAGNLYVIGAVAGKQPQNFTDDYIPGVTNPDGTARADSCLVAIGGGKDVVTAGTGTDWSKGTSAPVPYTAGFGLDAFNGGPGYQSTFVAGSSRDGGAGPAFTGFPLKSVTAAAPVAVGGVIETGWVNRQGSILGTGMSQFGSGSAAAAAPTLEEVEEDDEEEAPPTALAKAAGIKDEAEAEVRYKAATKPAPNHKR